MTKMIATKSMRYATRRLLPDDEFVAKNGRDARLLSAIGKARYATDGAAPALREAAPSAAEILAQADGLHFLAFKSLASKLLGDETPAKKADIVEALKKRAQADG